jgi:hypothetical protein
MDAVRAWFWLCFFSLTWLVPVAWHGLAHTNLPGLPLVLVQTTNVSCLFPGSVAYVPVQYIQVLRPGEARWTTEEDTPYLRMSPFGHRTRFDEMIRKTLDRPGALKSLAVYIARRHYVTTGRHPVAVRFVTGIVLPDLAPRGHFRKPGLHEIDPIRRDVWFTVAFVPLSVDLLRQRP